MVGSKRATSFRRLHPQKNETIRGKREGIQTQEISAEQVYIFSVIVGPFIS
jgi:hypothetical protein